MVANVDDQNRAWSHRIREKQGMEDMTKMEKVRAQELERQDV